jgi:hypothetical protein
MTKDEELGLLNLLARCEEDDVAAQREFANRSFLNAVYQAVVKTLARKGASRNFKNEDIADLAKVCIWKVYEERDQLVGRRSDFKKSLTEFAVAFTTAYLREPRARL